MKYQKSVLVSLIVILLSTMLSPATAGATTTNKEKKKDWPKGPGISAESAVVMEASTGLVLYQKKKNTRLYPASITKIMTSLVAIENSSLKDVVTYSHNSVYDIEADSSKICANEGEKMTMEQCLYAILLESANDASYAVAEHVAGSLSAFCDMMNEKAKQLGCLNTHFVNPHGLQNKDHYTTSYDMALITQEAIKNNTFFKIFGTRTYVVPPTNKQPETRYWSHHHKFIKRSVYLYDDCNGGKTGYTSTANHTLVTTAKRGNMQLICVIMNDAGAETQYTDTQKLLDYGFDNFSIYPIKDTSATDALNESPLFTKFSPLLNDTESPIVTDENGYLVLPNSVSIKEANKSISFNKDSKDLKAGNVIGKIAYTYKDKYVGGADIILNNIQILSSLSSGKKSTAKTPAPSNTSTAKTQKKSKKSGNIFIVVFGVIIGIILILGIIYYIKVERPRLKRRNAYYRKRARRKRHQNNDYLDF